MLFDWQQFHASETRTPAVVDPRRRLRICLAAFLAMLLIVFGRAVQLEVTQGAGFRAEALRPVEKETVLPAARGRILARDGTVLACDRKVQAVAVQFRWLQEPPDARWLRTTVRTRISKADRKDAAKVAAEQATVLAERTDLARQLAQLCGLSPEQWAARAKQIQTRVLRIAENANRRRQSEAASSGSPLPTNLRSVPGEGQGVREANDSWAARLRRLLLEDPPPPRIIVVEELDYHVMADDAPPAAVAEIENHGDRYPGVKIVELSRRFYPGGAQAAHVLGHLGAAEEGELVGRMGAERQYESVLQGHRGTAVEQTDRGGRVLARYDRQPSVPGCDVTLTLDPSLQRTAEELLQSALQRRAIRPEAAEPAGGAIVVMDVETGAIHAAASAPAFDPNLFARGSSEELAAVLADKTHPLFDRVCRMAIPPGSTFKVLAAAALLESAAISPEARFNCQGYLHQPDRQRCEIYIRQGVGHDEVAMADALAVSCNTYFFHYAGQMGPRPLVDWATQFGFGRPTGIDLPGEASGTLPCPENIRQLEGHAWRTADTQSMAVGQGSLTATPLQVLCMTAAVANGGRLVTPHIALGVGTPSPQPIAGLQGKTLRTIREGLRRVVADPHGTAHGTVYIESLAVAGKTGTAETGADQASHAWFAGYVPAEEPKLAIVVVLEHAGDAATAAGPVAKRLVLRMEQLGML